MAKISDAQYIVNAVNAAGADVPEKSITSIARKTQNDFDLDWVLTELALIERPGAKDIIRIINKAKPTPKAHCGKCKNGFIYSLNRAVYRDMVANDVAILLPVMLPKSMCYCPNCGKTPERLQQRINSSDTDETGWIYVILMDFATYHLHIHPDIFDPTEIWNIQISPELSREQIKMVEAIREIADSRFPSLDPQQIINNAVNTATKTM